jgi:hypothetical protein
MFVLATGSCHWVLLRIGVNRSGSDPFGLVLGCLIGRRSHIFDWGFGKAIGHAAKLRGDPVSLRHALRVIHRLLPGLFSSFDPVLLLPLRKHYVNRHLEYHVKFFASTGPARATKRIPRLRATVGPQSLHSQCLTLGTRRQRSWERGGSKSWDTSPASQRPATAAPLRDCGIIPLPIPAASRDTILPLWRAPKASCAGTSSSTKYWDRN